MRASHALYVLVILSVTVLTFTFYGYRQTITVRGKSEKIGLQEFLFTELDHPSRYEDSILVFTEDGQSAYQFPIPDLPEAPESDEVVMVEIEPTSHVLGEMLAKIQLKKEPGDKPHNDSKISNKGYNPTTSPTKNTSPLFILGAYPEIEPPYVRPNYEKDLLGLNKRQEDYCGKVDNYNFEHPENMFQKSHFYTDFTNNAFARFFVIRKIANVTDNHLPQSDGVHNYFRQYSLDANITHFFISQSSFHNYYQLGKQAICATQTYNHVPGQSVFVAKDTVLNMLSTYLEKYKTRSQCFNKHTLFPLSYRLDNQDECEEFFEILRSKEYQKKAASYPFQYLIKISRDFHQSRGVFLLDEELTKYLQYEYLSGIKCDQLTHPLMAQTYIANPLLLDFDNKFDFRIYMLIASTNPMIVYYHDGFLRVSLNSFDPFSRDKATHMTNTHLSDKILKEAKENNTKIHGMNASELMEYTWWSFTKFQNFLLETGRVTDLDWLDNYLRPAFKRTLIHLIRMSQDSFWKQSNVYALHGVDFMLDDELNLWFIESNPSPQLGSDSKEKSKIYIKFLFEAFEIVHSYYRSRMKRVYDIVNRMQEERKRIGDVNLEKWKLEYQEGVKNRLEPEYAISTENSFQLIIDENLPGAEAYLGYLSEECL